MDQRINDDPYYTYRAKIVGRRRDRGGRFKDPAGIEGLRNCFIAPRHPYVVITYGIDRHHHAHPIAACSGDDIMDMKQSVSTLPLTIVEPTQRVYGKLAPMYGRWRIEYLPPWGRGVSNPRQSAWRRRSSAYGSLAQMRSLLCTLVYKDIQKRGRHRRVYRVVLDQQVYPDKGGRIYNLFNYYHLNRLKPWIEDAPDEDANELMPDEIHGK